EEWKQRIAVIFMRSPRDGPGRIASARRWPMSMPYTDLPDYQERVASFVDMHALRAGAEARVMDLVSEVGEVAKEVLKATRYGEHPFMPGDTWSEEVADVFFSLISLANATNVNLDQDRKSTRLNSSHVAISYAVFC